MCSNLQLRDSGDIQSIVMVVSPLAAQIKDQGREMTVRGARAVHLGEVDDI